MIHCIAIDDEPIALSIINEHCNRYGNIRLETFTSPVEGIRRIQQTRPEIVFLDIELTSHNGLELAKEMPEGTLLIFTTAFSQYALDGFNLNAIDFLHKPIFFPRFLQSMEKAQAWLNKSKALSVGSPAITLKADHKNVVISLDSISYIEAMDNYVKVYRTDQPVVISQITMKALESILPSETFIRVHRSFIVPLNMIDCFSNRQIHVRGVHKPIPVGRAYNEKFQKTYGTIRSGR